MGFVYDLAVLVENMHRSRGPEETDAAAAEK